MPKLRLESPENNSPELEKAISDSVFMVEQAGGRILTTNTEGAPIEPNLEYTPKDHEAWIPNEEQQNFINYIVVEGAKIGLDIIGTRPNDR